MYYGLASASPMVSQSLHRKDCRVKKKVCYDVSVSSIKAQEGAPWFLPCLCQRKDTPRVFSCCR